MNRIFILLFLFLSACSGPEGAKGEKGDKGDSASNLVVKNANGEVVLTHEKENVWRLNNQSLIQLNSNNGQFILGLSAIQYSNFGFKSFTCYHEDERCEQPCVIGDNQVFDVASVRANFPVKDSLFVTYQFSGLGVISPKQVYRLTGEVSSSSTSARSYSEYGQFGNGELYRYCNTLFPSKEILSSAVYVPVDIVLPDLTGAQFDQIR